MGDFADDLGPGYLNLVVRRVAQRIGAAGDAYLQQTGGAAGAGSTAVLACIARRAGVSIAEIAAVLGYTHQAVAKSVSALEGAGLVRSVVSQSDQRKRALSLTSKGRAEAAQVEALAAKAALVFEEAFEEIGVDLFKALRAFEQALDRRPLLGRLTDVQQTRPRKRKTAN
jgi:DNA-binding MarR family transcriptional regulator